MFEMAESEMRRGDVNKSRKWREDRLWCAKKMPEEKMQQVKLKKCHRKKCQRQTPSSPKTENGVLAAACTSCGHLFKFRAVPPYKTAITFTVDGQQYTVGNEYGPSTVLNSWLREKRVSVGTKHMCYEGGCGACLVEVQIQNPKTQAKTSCAVNSCLLPLYACDGMEFRTVGYIGNLHDGLNPIQKQIADYNGSQCGYCTPGQVMNMFALKERYGASLTQKQVEDSFDGNLCRCTGYRPILKAFKDMAVPPSSCQGATFDIEELVTKMCSKTGQQCSGACSNDQTSRTVSTRLVFADTQWYKPATQKELIDILNASAGKTIRFLFGNTSTGFHRDLSPGNYDVVIDPTALSLLYGITFDTNVVIGSGLTLSNLYDAFLGAKQQPGMAYLGECAHLLLRVANLPVRNRATWTGNICMKRTHNDFPSDVFVMLQVLNAQLLIGFLGDSIPISSFLTTNIAGKIIIGMSFASLDSDDYIQFYKVSKRAQNNTCYVSGGFRAKVDKTNGIILNSPIVIAYAGIGAKFNRATKTEQYLAGKQLTDPTVLQTALSTLKSELQVDVSPALSSAAYRTNLALSLFYKYVLHLAGDMADAQYRSGASDLFLDRPISTGVQTYDTVPVEYPVTEPVKKIEANAQATGEAEYIDDMGDFPRQLEAAFVLSTVGNAKLDTIDPTEALKIPGVVKVITAKDIHDNNIAPPNRTVEEVLASTNISYCGQPVALVLAESYGTALGAAAAVKVSYTDIQTPIVDIRDAIKRKSFFPVTIPNKIVGDPDQAIAQSQKKLSGTIAMGSQYHFHFETQISVCVPKEDGLNVYTSTQFINETQNAISRVTGLAKNSVRVRVKRLGGGFGGKNFANNVVAAACSMAASIVQRPVKLRLTLGDNMKMIGKRFPHLADYEVGFTDDGKLNGIKLTHYIDCGYYPWNGVGALQTRSDNAYMCQNWKISDVAVKTNTAANTSARAPANLPATFVIESIMEHVAKSLGKDATDIRVLNTYNQGAADPLLGMVLDDCLLKQYIANLQTDTQFAQRKQQIETFNASNRWKKKGISLVPLKYGIGGRGVHYGCFLAVYSVDGTVAISHGGIDMGQGVNTKVAQVCAYELGIPITLIKIVATNSLIGANSSISSGSVTSENCCLAVIECCKTLNDRIEPVRQKLKDKSWTTVINKCFAEKIDLCVRSWSDNHTTTPEMYFSYGATITEVEFDVLIGEHQISRTDVLFDCGQSINPALDVGQVEGAFVMGLGYWLTEECKYDPQTGAILTDSTLDYQPPSSKDIPVDFRISFLKKHPSKVGILGAKASGEPSICMSCSALFAVKRAIEAARKDVGQDVFFPLNGPATPEVCQLFCLTDPTDFVLK